MNFARCSRTAFVVSFVVFGLASASESGTASMIHERIARLESAWTPGSGEEETSYYQGATKIANDLSSIDEGDANREGLALLRSVLAKSSANKEFREADIAVGSSDLESIQSLTRFLLNHDAVPAALQSDKAVTLAAVLGVIRGEVKPNYVEKRVYENVMPPVGEGILIAGMDPDSIADPAAREKYKIAIRENERINLENRRQSMLQILEREFATPVVAYLVRIVARGGDDPEKVRAAISRARLTPQELRQILNP